VVSGAFLLLVATAVYGNQLAPIETIMVLAFLGALTGDQVGFHIGRWVGTRFHHSRLAKRYRNSVDKSEALIRRHGAMAVFIGRFVPAIRSLIPATMGISGFDGRRYLLLDALACALWSTALGAIVLGLDFGFSSGT
jgi:membrane-associated protein